MVIIPGNTKTIYACMVPCVYQGLWHVVQALDDELVVLSVRPFWPES